MLTGKKRKEIKNLLADVPLAEICAELGVNRTTLWRAINGKVKSKQESIDKLKQVVEAAKQHRERRTAELENL